VVGVAEPPDWLDEADGELVRRVDAVLGFAVQLSKGWLACRLGCAECCIGPFEITALDARRLRRGVRDLEARDAVRAREVRARAAEQWRSFAGSFPGSAGCGTLSRDEHGREAFFAAHSGVPCPALDPATGGCVLYAHRPISCRTYGLPVSCSGEVLAPCRLNFVGAAPGVVAACAADPDPEDLESAILARMERAGLSGDTVVAAALALVGQAASGRSLRGTCGRGARRGPAPRRRTS
jgi:Fe-S-cluster containining protein